MSDTLLTTSENNDGGEIVVDPLDRVYWNDIWSYDSPEDATLSRNVGCWYDEVSRLRKLCADNGIDVA